MIGLIVQYLIHTTAHGFNRLLNGPARGNGGRFRKLWAVAIAVAFTTAGVVIGRSKRALDADPIATNFKYGLLEVKQCKLVIRNAYYSTYKWKVCHRL